MLNLPRQASLAWTTVGGRLIFLPFPKDPISFFATLWHHQVDHNPDMSDLDFMLLFLDQVERWEPDCSSTHCGSGNKQTALCLGFKAKFISIRLVLLWRWYLPVAHKKTCWWWIRSKFKTVVSATWVWVWPVDIFTHMFYCGIQTLMIFTLVTF